MRGKTFPPIRTPAQAIAEARAVTGGPAVIADVWDNPGGGVAGDATVILRALIDAGVGGVEVILNTVRSQAFERTVFTAMGIDPAAKKVLVVKSTNHFYADFSKLAAKVIYCEAGKPYPNNPRTTPYAKAPKRIWPIVEEPFG